MFFFKTDIFVLKFRCTIYSVTDVFSNQYGLPEIWTSCMEAFLSFFY